MSARTFLRIFCSFFLLCTTSFAQIVDMVEYGGLCNASAAVALEKDCFIVADDEGTTKTALKIFRRANPSAPIAEVMLTTAALKLADDESPELDLEGAARLGEIVYWIGSHSANKHGELRQNRHKLFATKITTKNSSYEVKVIGKAYSQLIRDLERDAAYTALKLGKAAAKSPEEEGSLNIEGLSASPEGDLLIGFRSPLIEGQALIACLKNPQAVITEKKAKFAPPVLLDLAGRGIRSLEWSAEHKRYFILAGGATSGQRSQLWAWTGVPDEKPTLVPGFDFKDLNPEALFCEGLQVTILSDDGHRSMNGVKRDCSADGISKSFRAETRSIQLP